MPVLVVERHSDCTRSPLDEIDSSFYTRARLYRTRGHFFDVPVMFYIYICVHVHNLQMTKQLRVVIADRIEKERERDYMY